MTGLTRTVGFVRLEPKPIRAPSPAPPPRIPRVARLVALAIRFDRLLRDGSVENLSELAKLARVSQPRLTQIVNLSLLAPDIIDSLLHLRAVKAGREVIHERAVRRLATEPDWAVQRRLWTALVRTASAQR